MMKRMVSTSLLTQEEFNQS